MGYSARYHAASLAAVFLALAVGILIGVGFGSDLVSGTADDLEESLGSDLDEAREQIADLEAELDAERAFEAAVYPAVVDRQLRGERIAVIGLGGLSTEIADDAEQAIGPSGAEVGEVGVVSLPPDLGALAGLADGRAARRVERGNPEAVREVAAKAGRALLRGGPGFDQLRGSVLGRYSGSPEGIDGVIVVRERPGELEPDDAEASNALEDGLVAGFRARDVPVVGAELEATEPSAVSFFEAEGISSVDSVDLLSGKVALVFALAGADGSFGVKESAESLLPDLLAPSKAEARGGKRKRD